jgi:virginiamycin A acetyltransferase
VVRVPRLSVGPGTGINGRSTFKGGGPVDIGAYTSVSERVIIITNDHRLTGANVLLGLNHRFGWAPELTRVDRVAVGNAVWIGDRVTILPGVSIGDGAILAAGSVITRDVESFTVVAGVPARPIRPRFAPEVSQTLADIAWWTWPEARIARNREFFEADFTDMHPMDILNLVVS